MSKRISWTVLCFLTVLVYDRPAFADGMVLFDFNQIYTQSKKGANASDIEAYMEGLFGSNISVSQNTTAGNSFLKVGKGKDAPGITIDFGGNPIDSFSVDFQLFKKAKNFTILADGVAINQQALSKAQRKAGLTGHQSSYFFDTPVHTLQFIGINKKSFAIDNLVINIPLPADEQLDEESESDSNENGNNSFGNGLLGGAGAGGDTIITNQVTAAVPEPSSLLMFAIGLSGAWFSRRVLLL
jgi:PEP-CTERM motif